MLVGETGFIVCTGLSIILPWPNVVFVGCGVGCRSIVVEISPTPKLVRVSGVVGEDIVAFVTGEAVGAGESTGGGRVIGAGVYSGSFVIFLLTLELFSSFFSTFFLLLVFCFELLSISLHFNTYWTDPLLMVGSFVEGTLASVWTFGSALLLLLLLGDAFEATVGVSDSLKSMLFDALSSTLRESKNLDLLF